ncbi:MAG TPA: Gfo/Idh/MocA family oxidoreductase [Galbitalea sp.]|nr:Gfo/Idh/MocA family oxidoreductase [Galbitalea sp.]
MSIPETDAPIRIGIIGTGWRSGGFAGVMASRPDLFAAVGVLSRTHGSASRFGERFGIPTVGDVDELLSRGAPDFVLLSVSADSAAALLVELARRGIPTLVETPIAASIEEMMNLARELPAGAPIQSAEQYRFQPQHAARLEVARRGLLGAVSSTRVSSAHFYHGVSLMRAALGIGFERARIVASSYRDRTTASLGRDGWSADSPVNTTERVIANIEFPDAGSLGLYDFTEEQYFSPIRSRHFSIAGTSGDLVDDSVHLLTGPGEPLHLALRRDTTGTDGDLEGSFLRRITMGERVVYTNPLAPARLSDDEIAIGSVLMGMAEFVRDGTALYPFADAAEDQYLSLLIREAVETGGPVETKDRPWASDVSVLARS